MKKALIQFLIQLKNESSLRKKFVNLRLNLQYLNVMEFLYREGFIQSAKFDSSCIHYVIYLRFFEQQPLINKLKIFSAPSKKCFISFRELALIPNKKLFLLLTTNKGLLTYLQCKKLKIGGKLLFCIL